MVQVSTDHAEQLLDSLDQCQEQLEVFRAEQDRLQQLESQLVARIRDRKREFKTMFGVSPINIKTQRTVIKPRSPFQFKLNLDDIGVSREVSSNDDNVPVNEEDEVTPVSSPRGAEDVPPPETEKRVRFDPSSDQTVTMTPATPELEESLDQTPVTSGKRAQLRARKQSRKSFDTLKCSLNFLKTPQTAVRSSTKGHLRQTPSAAAPTPMALR